MEGHARAAGQWGAAAADEGWLVPALMPAAPPVAPRGPAADGCRFARALMRAVCWRNPLVGRIVMA